MQSPQITPSLPLGQAPHAVRRPHAEPPPPASIFRFFMRLSFSMRFRGLPTHGPPPHTVSRFPHTATRLTHFPIRFGRSPQAGHSPIRHGRSPIARLSPNTIHIIDKAAGFHFDETSGSSSTNPQPTPPSKHPEPALPSSKPSAGQVQQMLQTCEVGGAVTSCMRIPARTVMRTLSWARVRPWSYLHGYARIFTAMVMRIPARPWRKPIRRDQRTAQQIPNQPCQANTLKLRNASTNLQSNRPTQNAWGAWASTSTAASMTTTGAGPLRVCDRA